MHLRLLSALAVAAALCAGPAAATDTSSLGAFVKSCASDAKGCHLMTLNAIQSAKNAKYGCIPADASDERAADKLLDWLRAANGNPKYASEPLADLMWTGVDEIWPCKK